MKEEVNKEVSYVLGLIEYLERNLQKIIRESKDDSDYYKGQVNTYDEIIKHIQKTYK